MRLTLRSGRYFSRCFAGIHGPGGAARAGAVATCRASARGEARLLLVGSGVGFGVGLGLGLGVVPILSGFTGGLVQMGWRGCWTTCLGLGLGLGLGSGLGSGLGLALGLGILPAASTCTARKSAASPPG